MSLYVNAVTRTDGPSAVSQTDSFPWRAFSWSGRPCLILTSIRRLQRKSSTPGCRPTLPVANPDRICEFLGSAGRRFSVPACESTTRRAQRRSRLAEGHRLKRREAVLTAASTARASITSGSACHNLERRRQPDRKNQGPRAGEVLAPPISALLYGRKSHHRHQQVPQDQASAGVLAPCAPRPRTGQSREIEGETQQGSRKSGLRPRRGDRCGRGGEPRIARRRSGHPRARAERAARTRLGRKKE